MYGAVRYPDYQNMPLSHILFITQLTFTTKWTSLRSSFVQIIASTVMVDFRLAENILQHKSTQTVTFKLEFN